jgi:alkanesulfonate monooxygenase SsuD/methylene tetrahydromethanopterin reductase-like flavin-dependent oxidoreductase (luciferase family)
VKKEKKESTMTQVQFGWNVPSGSTELPQQAFLAGLRAGLDTIAGHFDSVWYMDHVQSGTNPILEGWTTLTYLAALRPELRYGHLVLCQLFRNPALLAKMAATFQYMSQGHFILGIGAGWFEEEAKAYHLPFPPTGQRVSELEEQLQIINALWRENEVTFEGKYHQVSGAICLPRPEPLPPVLIGGHKPRMMRLVARYADWWNGYGNIGAVGLEKTREHLKALDAACESVGRDPRTLRRTASITCFCAPTEQKVQALLTTYPSRFGPSFVGTPGQVVEQLQPLVEAGFDYFMIRAGGVPTDLTTLEMLSHEVLPALNKGR